MLSEFKIKKKEFNVLVLFDFDRVCRKKYFGFVYSNQLLFA